MINISVSPSKVENFRKFYDEELKGIVTEEAVVQSIMGTTPWKPAMIFGSAFHKILEVDASQFYNPKTGLYVVQDDQMPEPITMVQSEVDVANKYRESYPHMIHEIKCHYRTLIGKYDVRVNMRIDGMSGIVVHEKKTTSKSPEVGNYERSVQWKFYALATECRVIQYDIFQIKEYKSGPREITHIPFQFFPYAEMKGDVDRWIMHLIRFAEDRNLLDYLIPKWDNEDLFPVSNETIFGTT